MHIHVYTNLILALSIILCSFEQQAVLNTSAVARAAEPLEDVDMTEEEVALRGGGWVGSADARQCNVLEWRLAGSYMFGPQERFLFLSTY